MSLIRFFAQVAVIHQASRAPWRLGHAPWL